MSVRHAVVTNMDRLEIPTCTLCSGGDGIVIWLHAISGKLLHISCGSVRVVFDIKFGCEIGDACVRFIKLANPSCVIFKDLRQLQQPGMADVHGGPRRQIPRCKSVMTGFYCDGFSMLNSGNWNPDDIEDQDTLSGLTFSWMIAYITWCGCEMSINENTDAIAKLLLRADGTRRRPVDDIVEVYRENGFLANWRLADALDYGAVCTLGGSLTVGLSFNS